MGGRNELYAICNLETVCRGSDDDRLYQIIGRDWCRSTPCFRWWFRSLVRAVLPRKFRTSRRPRYAKHNNSIYDLSNVVHRENDSTVDEQVRRSNVAKSAA